MRLSEPILVWRDGILTRFVIFTEEEIQRLSEHASVTEWDQDGNKVIYVSEDGYRALTDPITPTTLLS